MSHLRLPSLLLAAALAGAAAPAAAAPDTRADLVRRIVEAQGLAETFELQLAEQRKAVGAYAQKLFDSTTTAAGRQPTAEQKAALERFFSGVALMMGGRELAETWQSMYGQDLSEAELRGILRYWQSPVGRKDIAASRAAASAMARWANEQMQKRAEPLIKQLVQDLSAAN